MERVMLLFRMGFPKFFQPMVLTDYLRLTPQTGHIPSIVEPVVVTVSQSPPTLLINTLKSNELAVSCVEVYAREHMPNP